MPGLFLCTSSVLSYFGSLSLVEEEPIGARNLARSARLALAFPLQKKRSLRAFPERIQSLFQAALRSVGSAWIAVLPEMVQSLSLAET